MMVCCRGGQRFQVGENFRPQGNRTMGSGGRVVQEGVGGRVDGCTGGRTHTDMRRSYEFVAMIRETLKNETKW